MSSPRRTGRGTALITGASSGIGLSFGHVLAGEGYDLVLVARNPDRLDQATEGLQRRYPARAIRAWAVDLATPDAAGAVFSRVRQEGIHVDVLVNNAGFGRQEAFAESDLSTDLDMLRVNVAALTALTRLFLGEMLPRGSGKILNVASTAAFSPGPYMAVYYASKAYVLSFSEAIAEELRGTGVTVTCLCPGATTTNFASRAGMDTSRVFRSRLVMSADAVAWAGYRGLLRGEAVVIPGVANRLGALGLRFVPHRLALPLIRRFQKPRS